MSAVLLGRRLRALRRLKRLTQLELASEVGISVSMLSTIERGIKYPRVELIRKLARALDVPLEEFLYCPKLLKSALEALLNSAHSLACI